MNRLRNYLNISSGMSGYVGAPQSAFQSALIDAGAEPEMILNVTAQANTMAIEEMNDIFGEESEFMPE